MELWIQNCQVPSSSRVAVSLLCFLNQIQSLSAPIPFNGPPVCRCWTLWKSRAALLCWFCDHTDCGTPRLDALRWRISGNIISGWLIPSTENVAGQLKRISCFSWEGPNLGEIFEKSKGDLLAEVILGQGEETGLLLDDVTVKNRWWHSRRTCSLSLHIWLTGSYTGHRQ